MCCFNRSVTSLLTGAVQNVACIRVTSMHLIILETLKDGKHFPFKQKFRTGVPQGGRVTTHTSPLTGLLLAFIFGFIHCYHCCCCCCWCNSRPPLRCRISCPLQSCAWSMAYTCSRVSTALRTGEEGRPPPATDRILRRCR